MLHSMDGLVQFILKFLNRKINGNSQEIKCAKKQEVSENCNLVIDNLKCVSKHSGLHEVTGSNCNTRLKFLKNPGE